MSRKVLLYKLTAVITDASDLQTLTGIADGSSDLGTFSGSTIADSTDIKTALQTLETSVEDISAVDSAVVDAGDNVNRLVGATCWYYPVDGNGDDNYLFQLL